MKVKIVAAPIFDGTYDPEQEINAALKQGWFLKETHAPVTDIGIWLVAILVDDVEPREVIATINREV